MRSTKFWVLAILFILFMASILSLLIIRANNLSDLSDTAVANIYHNGECIRSISLSEVEAEYTLQIDGNLTNIITVGRGRICVSDATCPDHVCVRQGWITNGVVPIVCLPNNLVIQIDGAPKTDIDAIAR